FISTKKTEGLYKLCLMKNKQDYIDAFSGFGEILLRLSRKFNYPSRYVNSSTKRQKIGREALLRHIELFHALSQKNNIDIKGELSILRRMYESDVIWDEITNIEYVNPSSKYVYDFTIEDTETFTTFDGIITHNTMRSYILATQRDRLSKVTQGLPRLIEIFDVRKTFEKNMRIYLKPEYNKKERAREVAIKIKEKTVSDVLISDSIDLVDMRIELELENEAMRDRVEKLVTKHIKADITFRGKKVFIKPKKDDIRTLRKIKSKLLKTHIDGIKGIEDVIVVKDDEDWLIQTAGTNLKKVLKLEEVDVARTTTNDIHQVYDVMGIEAARNVILNEAKETLDEQGLDVDIRHLMLLADTMTVDGDVKAVGRYGVSGGKASVLARANFEETKKHIVNAAFYGEKDDLRGIIENVLLGQIAPVGTGMVELTVDIEKMRTAIKGK
ncbi:MAG: intein-containing DNA-directed RNA polymerase subunit A'', partial [Candidatus Aenigmarchaeota archaeon]|nr:intein-containing DNA-directed RNA polymerase subunit A'' [Candidatus Aenigmarchaeota archaeon]